MRRLAAILLLAICVTARAHDAGLSNMDVTFAPGAIEVRLTARIEDLAAVERSGVLVDAGHSVELRADGVEVAPHVAEQGEEDTTSLLFTVRFPRPAAQSLAIRCAFFQAMPQGHRQIFRVRDANGKLLISRLLTKKSDWIELPSVVAQVSDSPARESKPESSAAGFFRLGIEHIFTGYDHILFLLGLLLVCGSFWSAARIVTSFTIAHSITLAIATIGVFDLSPRIVEPAIAASIVFVGIENLVRSRESDWRWMLAFAFGLVHGLGFAGALREAGVGVGGAPVAMPLLGFNLGVESGQLCIVALVLPVLLRLQSNPLYLRRVVPVGSAAIVAAGAWWLVQRTMAG